MLPWDTYREKVLSIGAILADLGAKRGELQKMQDVYAPDYLAGKTSEIQEAARGKISAAFVEIREDIADEIDRARKKAAIEIPWEERTYHATAGAQDIAGKQPEEILAVFTAAGQDGNRGRIEELRRLIDPLFGAAGSPLFFRWRELVQRYMTPEELALVRIQAEGSRMITAANEMEQYALWALDSGQAEGQSLNTLASSYELARKQAISQADAAAPKLEAAA